MTTSLSPEQTPPRMFYTRTQYSCSCSALLRTEDDLIYEEAVVLIARPRSQSNFQDETASLQQRTENLRPIIILSERPRRQLIESSNRHRAQSVASVPHLSQHSAAQEDINVVDRGRPDVFGSLSRGDRLQLQPTRAQIANCLPPDHLDPPPGYWQAINPSQLIHPIPRSRSVILQPKDDELFLDPDFPTLSNDLALPIITHHARVGTPNSFELEHWARMDEAG